MLDVFDRWARDYAVTPEFILREPVGSLADALGERGWQYHSLDYTFWSDASPPVNPEDVFRNALRNNRAVLGIEEIIRTVKPDIVMTNSIVCPWAALAAHFQKVPHVWFVREYGDLDHGRTFEIGQRQTLEDVGNLSDLVVANSKTLQEHIAQYVDGDKLTTLYTPFNLTNITKRALQKVPSPFRSKHSLKLITTNNIAFSKGQVEAAEATGMLNREGFETELCIMGSGAPDCIAAIKETTKKYGIENKVHLIGSQRDTAPYIALANVGVMASRKEAFGRATFECLAVGKPVVGANSGATPEMVESGVNGYLYEQGNARSLAVELKHYAEDKTLIIKHGKAARAKAEKMMMSEYSVDALYEKIEKVVRAKPGAKIPSINFTHRWLEYLEVAQQCIYDSGAFSLRRLLRLRLRQKVKPIYLQIKKIKAQLTGRNG